MIDPKQLLEQVLGGSVAGDWRGAASQARDRLNQASGTQAFGAGAVTGGLLGLLLGSRKVRKLAGGAAGYGGAAVLGALAYRAWETYRHGAGAAPGAGPAQATPSLATTTTPPALLPHAQPAADGSSFELVLVRGMIAAAKADGTVDANEQQRLFAEVERLGLDAQDKALVFDALAKPAEPAVIASLVASPEQAAELYLASRLAIDPDSAAERAYLDALAARLNLPVEVRASLDREALA